MHNAATYEKVAVEIQRLSHARQLPLPRRMSEAASGFDLMAAVEEELILQPGDRTLVPTGFCMAIPHGYEVQIRPRSGLALHHGVTVLNAPGTIDSDYRGEVKILLVNLGNEPFTVERGARIAQAIVASVAGSVSLAEVAQLGETTRGDGGFGHTGT